MFNVSASSFTSRMWFFSDVKEMFEKKRYLSILSDSYVHLESGLLHQGCFCKESLTLNHFALVVNGSF